MLLSTVTLLQCSNCTIVREILHVTGGSVIAIEASYSEAAI